MLQAQRDRRAANGNANTKKYEKTKKGKLVRTYRNMLSRVEGILQKKSHLYEGKDILSKEAFYKWSMQDPQFHKLHDEWVASGYDRRLSPSIDRIDVALGYILGNMQWLTHSENSSKASRQKRPRLKPRLCPDVG
jgi:hypothetical protein